MSDIRETFPILEDSATGAGVAPTKSLSGDAASGKVSLPVLAFRDSSGNLVFPQLDPEGRLPVTGDTQGTPLKARAQDTAGSATLVDLTGASLTLVISKTYVKMAMTVSCLQETLFQLVASDNAVETILAEILVGPGQYNFTYHHEGMEHAAGSTGPQLLKVKYQNLNKLSTVRANLSVIQAA